MGRSAGCPHITFLHSSLQANGNRKETGKKQRSKHDCQYRNRIFLSFQRALCQKFQDRSVVIPKNAYRLNSARYKM